jgi:ribosomal RNA-processing protein 9
VGSFSESLDQIRYNPASTSRLVTRGHRLTVTSAVASENGRHLFTCGKEGDIFHWDLATGKQSRVFKKSLPKKGQRRQHHAGEDINGHSGELWTLALSSDGQYLASGGKDRHIGVWDVEKGIWVKGFKGHKDSICVGDSGLSKEFMLNAKLGSRIPEGKSPAIFGFP